MTQIAVKLSDDLLREVDDLVAQGVFASRFSVVRSGLEAVVFAQRDRAVDQAYADGYRDIPESDQELSAARRLAVRAIHDERGRSGGSEGRGLVGRSARP